MLPSTQRITNMRKHGFLTALLALALTACGGGDDAFQGGAGGGGGPGPAVATVTLITSSPTISSDGALPATISAFVRNASNQFMTNVPVTFSASSGGLLITQGSTDANGLATATLSSAGDPTGRTITVTAMAGTITATVNVNVTGSTLTVQGPVALTLNQVGNYRVTLLDSAGRGIVGRTVTIASARTNTLSAASVTTDSTGSATFNLTAVNGGNDTITATSLGVTATQAVAVNSDSFTVTDPVAATEVNLGVARSVTVRWLINNVPVVNQPVTFATTRGTLTLASVNTDAAGLATTSVSSTNAGGAVVTATGGTSTARATLEFVAQTPASIDVQPSVFSIGPNQTSTLTAVVRDAVGNLVKNRTVVFTLNDVTGGTLSVGAAVTDSQGRAQTVYTASNTTSANGGVLITAAVQGFPGVTPRQVALTVARREVFISMGTGNTLSEPNPAQYQVPYIVQVTDANGNGVANVAVALRILSQRYYKGNRVPAGTTGWGTAYTVSGGCADEDVDRDGLLDPGEDFNSSTRIEAGNIASVAPSNAVTDANGFVQVSVYYPQEYAYYLDVSLSASATVSGTEYVRSSNFMVQGIATDFNNPNIGPPGPVSPFGTATVCSSPN
jgi:Bacterial Ig-like domain (group 1)